MQLRRNLSESLNAIRQEQDLTLSDLAEKLGVARSCLQQMLHGQGNPSLNTVERMAEQLEVDPVALLSTAPQNNRAALFLHMTMQCAHQLPAERQQALEKLVLEITQLWEDSEA